ncbi:MAG TPA: sigma-70 family RNA polymerase sigma factor [Ruminococcus sp.]|nr:sigma-70 family RNA polymerase sigma factor [Ruminococcus sp.]
MGRNLALDSLRRKPKALRAGAAEILDIAGDEDIEANYLREEQRIAVHRALRKLRPEYRQAVCLVYLEGFKVSDAAAVMGKSSRQMTNLLYQAKKALKTELEKEGIFHAGL